MVLDNLLNKGLGVAVGVGRADGAVLGDGDHVLEARGVTVDSGRRGEDNVGDVVVLHGLEQRHGAGNVDPVVLEGDLARLADGLERGKVDNAVDIGVRLEDLVEASLVGDINLVEGRALLGDALDTVQNDLGRVVETVDDDDLVAVLEQGHSSERADVAGATADENGADSHCDGLRGDAVRGCWWWWWSRAVATFEEG